MSKKAGTSLVDQISAMDAKLQVDKVQSDEYRNQRYSVLAKFIAAQNKAEAKGKDGAAPRKPAGASPQLTKAQAALREGVSLGPGSAAAQRALQLFTACLDAEPTNSDAWFGRGAALAAVEGIELCADEAKLCYTQCCRLDPRHVSAQAELGSLLWSEGFEEEAEAATKAALKLDPKHPLALLTQGHMMFARGDARGAEQSVRRSVDLGSPLKNTAALFSLGTLLANKGDDVGAEDAFRKVIDTITNGSAAASPESSRSSKGGGTTPGLALAAPAHFELAGLLENRGDVAGAEEHYRHAERLDPKNADAPAALGNLLHHAPPAPSSGRSAKAQTLEAELSYRRALEIDPRHADARYNLGILLKSSGKQSDMRASVDLLRHPDFGASALTEESIMSAVEGNDQ